MPADILQDTFDVVVDDATYTFKIPTIRYRIEVPARAVEIRRRAYPAGEVSERLGISDWQAVAFSRNCALLELYLVRCSATWPYGTEDSSKVDMSKPPVVDFEKFPPDRDDTIDRVGAAFEEARARFRQGRAADGRPGGAEAVAGVGDPGAP